MKSKTLAEKAAWDYLNGLPESEKFELVIINPVLILGPSLITGDFSSGQIITKLLSGKLPGMPKIMMSIVDVRDVAYAHLQAIKIEDAKNKRFILSSDSVWFKDVAEVLRQAYPR
jgi:dihydroflavonol-4-reductase